MASVTISHVTKTFEDNVIIRDFDQVFGDGEFITLLGPSGCGKTTMLRIIAGFEKPTSGELRIDDVLVSGGKTFVPPEKRGIGMVFQSYAVWPHMNVFDNVAYPLTITALRWPAAAGGVGPGADVRAEAAAVGRAAFQPRCQAAGIHAL